MKASLGVGEPPTRPNAKGGVNQIRVNMIRSHSAMRVHDGGRPPARPDVGCRSGRDTSPPINR
jgi:hypothetical protein